MQSSIILYDFSYKILLSNYHDFIRDNYIKVLKYNKGFEVQHYIVRCVCNESVALYVYDEHKQSSLHKYIVKKNLQFIEGVCDQYFNRDIVGILKSYMY